MPPVSAGEAVNRYRTDVGEVGDFPTWPPDVAGNRFVHHGGDHHGGSTGQDHAVRLLPLVAAYAHLRAPSGGGCSRYRRESGLAERSR